MGSAGCPTHILYIFRISSMRATYSAQLILPDFIIQRNSFILFKEPYNAFVMKRLHWQLKAQFIIPVLLLHVTHNLHKMLPGYNSAGCTRCEKIWKPDSSSDWLKKTGQNSYFQARKQKWRKGTDNLSQIGSTASCRILVTYSTVCDTYNIAHKNWNVRHKGLLRICELSFSQIAVN